MIKFYTYDEHPEHYGFVWRHWMLRVFNKYFFCLRSKIVGEISVRVSAI